jgi:hypothetical protein
LPTGLEGQRSLWLRVLGVAFELYRVDQPIAHASVVR